MNTYDARLCRSQVANSDSNGVFRVFFYKSLNFSNICSENPLNNAGKNDQTNQQPAISSENENPG